MAPLPGVWRGPYRLHAGPAGQPKASARVPVLQLQGDEQVQALVYCTVCGSQGVHEGCQKLLTITSVCDRCGYEVNDRYCRLTCERCGAQRDCSDP